MKLIDPRTEGIMLVSELVLSDPFKKLYTFLFIFEFFILNSEETPYFKLDFRSVWGIVVHFQKNKIIISWTFLIVLKGPEKFYKFVIIKYCIIFISLLIYYQSQIKTTVKEGFKVSQESLWV